MGELIYAGTAINGIADRELAWLDALTRHAFSEGKAFAVIITGTTDDGVVAAQNLWFAPHIPTQFAYQDYETIQINRQAFDEIYESVISTGLHLVGDGPFPYEFTRDSASSSGD